MKRFSPADPAKFRPLEFRRTVLQKPTLSAPNSMDRALCALLVFVLVL
jgi:hypothetical protein